MTPDDLRYTDDHEWARETADGVVRVGITDHAQRQLGDVVLVELPTVGDTVAVGDACGTVESTKSVSEIYPPVAGEVVAVNEALADEPELVNQEPYGGVEQAVELLVVRRPQVEHPAAAYDRLTDDA